MDTMRRPTEVERLYLDFDGFFASVEQLANPKLRNRPIAVIPFEGAVNSCVIACSREAKVLGIKNVMSIRDAVERCPDLILVPQSPDLYRRAHNALLSEISAVIPIDAVKSIDELTCRLDSNDKRDPAVLGHTIKKRLRLSVGPTITSSIGFAANRQLAKIACKVSKKTGPAGYGDGLLIWHPRDMPGPLLDCAVTDVPGIGSRLELRLLTAGINSIAGLLATSPKQLRALWGNVTGERLWYALHGYDVQTPPSGRSMYGHGRVLPPDSRSIASAHQAARVLLTKAARRLRRDGWSANRLALWFVIGAPDRREYGWQESLWLPSISDDPTILKAFEALWLKFAPTHKRSAPILRVGVVLMDLGRANERQLDWLADDDVQTQQSNALTSAIDGLNRRYGRTVVSVGPWNPPEGSYAGGKIAFTRIPRSEDFY